MEEYQIWPFLFIGVTGKKGLQFFFTVGCFYLFSAFEKLGIFFFKFILGVSRKLDMKMVTIGTFLRD